MKTTVLMIAVALLATPAGAADMAPQIMAPKILAPKILAPKILAPKNKASPASLENIHAYGDKNASCAVWTDGCRRCDRQQIESVSGTSGNVPRGTIFLRCGTIEYSRSLLGSSD